MTRKPIERLTDENRTLKAQINTQAQTITAKNIAIRRLERAVAALEAERRDLLARVGVKTTSGGLKA